MDEHSRSCRRTACSLRVSPRTLADWRRRSAQGQLTARLRGRPCRDATPEEQSLVTAILDETGPRLGVPALRAGCPTTSPSILTYLVKSYRRAYQADHQQMVESLHWKRAGTVWAMDHSQPPRPIDGCYDQIFAVRDLASGMQLAWAPVLGATVLEALPVLEGLVRMHGPPLVLKSDNGSAFKSAEFSQWLDRWQIEPLLSPVRMPRFNGACEAGIGAAKRRTEYLAARHGRFLDWSSNDLHAALQWANEEHYPSGFAAGTAAGRFAARLPLEPDERCDFRATVVKYAQEFKSHACTAGHPLTDTLLVVHHRRAVRRALVELGYLDITRRLIPQPLPSVKCARIK